MLYHCTSHQKKSLKPFWGAWESWQSFTFGRAGLEGEDSGQHRGLGANMLKARPRAAQGRACRKLWRSMGTEACPPPYSSSSLHPPSGMGGP